jgi:hypothetical protein
MLQDTLICKNYLMEYIEECRMICARNGIETKTRTQTTKGENLVSYYVVVLDYLDALLPVHNSLQQSLGFFDSA